MFDFLKKIKKKATDILGVVPTAQKTARRALEIVPRAVRRADILPKPQTFTQRLSELSLPQTRKPTRITLTMPSVAWNMPNVVPMYQKQIKRVPAPVQRASKAYNVTQSVVPKVARLGTNIMNLQRERNRNDFKENIAALKSGNLAQHTAKKYEQTKFFRPTGKVRVRDLIREFPVGVQETGKDILRDTARVGISLAELPQTLRTGRASTRWYNTPLGRINSLQSEAQNRVYRGDSPLKTIANTTLDLFLGAGDVAGLAKPIARTAKTPPLVPKEVRNIAHDLTQTLRPTMDWRSGLMRGLSQPGMTIKRYHTPAGAKKDALAQHIVRKQIANQAAGRNRAEKGFVSPQNILKPQKTVQLQRTVIQKDLSHALTSGSDTPVFFGRLSKEKLAKVNALRIKNGMAPIPSPDIYFHPNVIKKLRDRRISIDGMTPEYVADIAYSALHNTKSRVLPSRYDHVQHIAKIGPRKTSSAFVSDFNNAVSAKSAYPSRTVEIQKSTMDGPTFPSSSNLSYDKPRQSAGFSDLHGASYNKNTTHPIKNQATGDDIVRLAQSPFTPYNKQTLTIGRANPRTVQIIKNKTGIDVSAFTHQVDNYALRHAFKKHSKDPSPLTEDDFRLIPDIIKNPTSVALDNKTNKGLYAMKYIKKYQDIIYYIEEVRTGRNTLSMTTMYKTKGSGNGANLAADSSALGSPRLPLKEGTTPLPDPSMEKFTPQHQTGQDSVAPSIAEHLNNRKRQAQEAVNARLAKNIWKAPDEINNLLKTDIGQKVLSELHGRPRWLTYNEQSQILYDDVLANIANGTMPTSAPARRLYQTVVGETAYRSGLNAKEFVNTVDTALKHRKFQKAENMISPKQFSLQQQQRRLVIPKILRAMGYTKRELERKGADEIERLTKLQKLGYRKDDVADMDFDRMDRIIKMGATKSSLSNYYKKKHALDTNYLEDIDAGEVRDISPIGTGWKDVYRNMERAFGKNYWKIKERLLDPFDDAKKQFIDDQKKELSELNDRVVKQLGIRKGTKLSRYVQLFGEKKLLDNIQPGDLSADAKVAIDYDALVKLARGKKKELTRSVARELENHPDIKEDVIMRQLQRLAGKKWENVVKADQFFRRKYTELLASLNRVREGNFPTHPLYPESTKIIPERQNYYRHFREMEGISGLKNLFETTASIDPALAATSDVTNPKTRWLSFAQARKGDKTDYDAVGGYLDYIKHWAYAKNIDPYIQKFKGVDDELKGLLPHDSAPRIGLAEELARKTSPLQQITESTNPSEIRKILTDNGMSEKQAEWMSRELAQVTDYDYVTRWIAQKTRSNADDIMGKLSRQEAYVEHSDNRLNNFLVFIKNYSRDLAGKTNPLDRPFQENVIGRKIFRILDFANSMFKTNAVVGNLSSALAQVFNVPQGVAQAGARNAIRAIPNTMRSLWRNDGASSQSRFLAERYFDGYAAFDEGILHNTKKFALWTTMIGDKVGTMYIWNSLHRKALADGVADPIRYADDWTRRMVAGRGVGEVPIAQKSRITQIVMPFQLEVTNMWYALADIVRHSPNGINIAKKLVEFSVAAAIMNGVTRPIRGSDVSFDPIGALIDAYGEYQDDEGLGTNTLQAAGRIGGEFLSSMPVGQTIASIYPEYGGNAFGFEFPTRKKFFGEGDPTRFGTGTLPLIAATQKPVTRILLPYGGRQLEKTYEGAKTLLRGHTETKKGDVKTPVDRNVQNIVRGLMFGPNATSEMQKYRKTEQKPLSEKQTEIFKKSGAAAQTYFDNIMRERAAQKQKERIMKGLIPTSSEIAQQQQLPNSMFQLDNGMIYVPQLNRSFVTSRDAEIAIASAELMKNPSRNFLDMGDVVLRKSQKGVSVTTRDQYDAELYGAQLKSARNAEDYARWTELAEKQLHVYERMLNDPTMDEAERIKIQNNADILLRDAKKYAEYGGRFTKGRNKAIAINAKYTAKLANARKRGKLKEWVALADSHIAELERQLMSPNITETKAIQIQNKIITLRQQRDLYIEQGGFKKQKQNNLPVEFRYRLVDPTLTRISAMYANYRPRTARGRMRIPLMPGVRLAAPKVRRDKLYS